MEPSDRYHTLTAVLIGSEVILMFAGLGLLRARFGWPRLLGVAPETILPAIARQRSAIIGGYASYMLAALLLVPIAASLYPILSDTDASSTLLPPALAFGGAGGLATALGASRWVAVAPSLATSYVSAGASESTRAIIEVSYATFENYGVVVEQTIGLGLLTVPFVATLAHVLKSSDDHPDWLGDLGYLAAAILLFVIPTSLGLLPNWVLAVGLIVLQFWYAGLGVVVFLKATPDPSPGPDEDRTVG